MTKSRVALALAATGLTTLVLSGCGSSSGSSDGNVDTKPKTMVVSPALGRFKDDGANKVKVALFYGNGVKKDGVWDEATGKATFSGLTGNETNLVVQVEGGQYYDEASGVWLPFGDGKKLRTVVEKPYAEVAVTPLTHAAAQRLVEIDGAGVPKVQSGKTATDIVTENIREGQRYGLGDPLVPPVLVDEANQVQSTDANSAKKYALILATLAEAAKASGSNPADMAEELAKDLADGTLDGKEGEMPLSSTTYNPDDLTGANFTTLVNNAATAICADPTYSTQLATLAPTTVTTTVTEDDVQTTVTAITNAGDGLGQAKTLFSTLRSGILPYFNPTGTGYTQSQLTQVEANFAALQETAVGGVEQVDALSRVTQLAAKLLDKGKTSNDSEAMSWGQQFSTLNTHCSPDQNNVALGNYEATLAGTKFAAVCRIMTRLNVTETTYDQMVFLAYTDKASLNATETGLSDSATFRWTGRLDRYNAATGQRVIKGVNPDTGLEDATARKNGQVDVAVSFSDTGTDVNGSGSGTFGPLKVSGNLWPILQGTDAATVAMSITATLSGNWSGSSSVAGGTWTDTTTLSLKLDGSLEAKSGGQSVAKLTFAPSAGVGQPLLSGKVTGTQSWSDTGTSSASETISDGYLDAKVTFATAAYEVAGTLKLNKLALSSSEQQTCDVMTGCSYASTESNPSAQSASFAGTLTDKSDGTVVFDGSFAASSVDASKYDPTQPTSGTNYVTGTATLSGTFKKSPTDKGIKVQVVVSRTSAAAETWVLSYTDGNNNLTTEAKWTGGVTFASGTITNNLSSGVKVVFADSASGMTASVKTADDKPIGTIAGGVVTYVDGSSESIL